MPLSRAFALMVRKYNSNRLDQNKPYMPADPWKLPGAEKEKRRHAKNYAAMYETFVPKPGWNIADQ